MAANCRTWGTASVGRTYCTATWLGPHGPQGDPAGPQQWAGGTPGTRRRPKRTCGPTLGPARSIGPRITKYWTRAGLRTSCPRQLRKSSHGLTYGQDGEYIALQTSPVSELSVTIPRPPIAFDSIVATLKSATVDRTRVLTLPVWGWTGDGKTCAILTMFNYADPVEHGLGLALVDDVSELEAAIAGVPVYDGLRLPDLAKSTSDRLPGLAEAFLDNHSWPPGTDAPTPYLLRLRGVRETFGFLFLPDLQGGSFRGNDGAARAVLSGADACAIMVDPTRYTSDEVDSKRYRDAVDLRVQSCVQAGIPAAVMITKADISPPDNAAHVDQAHMRLERVIDGADSVRVFRVSVLGEGITLENGEPPPMKQRKPIALINAWAWLLSEALLRPAGEVKRTPPVRLSATVNEPTLKPKRVAELRQLGTFSAPPGRVLCDLLTSNSPTFLLINESQLSVATAGSRGDKPSVEPLGRLIGIADDGDFVGSAVNGEVFIGARQDVNAIWHGRAGDDITKVALPFPLRSWISLPGPRVVGVDDSGRIHLLQRTGERWEQKDWVHDFIEKTTRYACSWLSKAGAFLVSNGQQVASVEIRSDRFGDRFDIAVNAPFDDRDIVRISNVGLVARITPDGGVFSLTLGNFDRSFDDLEIDFTETSVALANDTALAACVSTTCDVHAVRVSGAQGIRAQSPVRLEDTPNGLCWAGTSGVLLATLAESWSLMQWRGSDE